MINRVPVLAENKHKFSEFSVRDYNNINVFILTETEDRFQDYIQTFVDTDKVILLEDWYENKNYSSSFVNWVQANFNTERVWLD